MARQEMVKVTSVTVEGNGLRSLRFPFDRPVKPGQFFMVWVPGVDEVPMSASYLFGEKGITVREVGPATKALNELKPGSLIGVRGPYGNGFEIGPGKALLIGGGTGMATLIPIAEFIWDMRKVDILIGARTKGELLFEERAELLSSEVHVSTDDGSRGMQGTVVEMAAKHLDEHGCDVIYACGPEKMLTAVLELCKRRGIPCQLSLERLMKCGSGLCGSCVIDGMRVCAEGPVFTGEQLVQAPEFGMWKRDETGRKVKL
ncbi:MAG: dihydroorotate dehydrogenase electron transfer subunit [Methanomassiliicoccales archaeon]|nr:dihydroorotate dehydrogenase electron transfer subunit [Methanomassiliicoccales archaeon]